MTAALSTWVLAIFGLSVMLVIWGFTVQFDGTVKNDAAGRFAMKIGAPVALLTGAIMWWSK